MLLTQDKNFKLIISPDRLSATLALHGAVPPAPLSADQIAAQVRAAGVKPDAQGQTNLQAFAAELAQGQTPAPALIAQGTGPIADIPGKIENLSELLVTEAKTHYDRSAFVTVQAGKPILRVIPPAPGRNGIDIFGKEIPRKLACEAVIRLGKNVEQRGDMIIATVPGKLEFDGEKVSVISALEVTSDVNFSVGNIDFPGDVIIHKNVLDLFKVQATGRITIQGLAEAAEVHAGLDLEVHGGIAGKEKGHFAAAGKIKAKYIKYAQIRAGSDVEVHSELLHCNLFCAGQLKVDGTLVGGKNSAAGGASVKLLGSDANVRTIIEIGIDEKIRETCDRLFPEIEIRRRKAEKVRQIVEPLLQNKKYLNAEQKEKATELLYQADELEAQIGKMIAEIRALAEKNQDQADPELEITGTIYPGVIIRFPRLEAQIREALAGPIKITTRRLNNQMAIVAIDPETESTLDLNASPSSEEMWHKIDKLLK